MITFDGTYFDGKSSRAHPVTIRADETRLIIADAGGDLSLDIPLRDCVIQPPLGKTSRVITLPEGAQCETDDFDAIAALEHRTGRNVGLRLVHVLESRWKMAAVSFAGLVVCVWAFMTYGIPFLAKKAAYAIPPAVAENLSEQTMKILDSRFLRPSKLPQSKARTLKARFKKLHEDIDSKQDYRLEFRKSPALGPNAFALPSGLIIMTDELVNLAESTRELEGVFVHEIAHVTYRHGMRSVIQDAGVFLLIAAVVGDITSITSAAGSLPTLLAQSGYSRDFEREADDTVAAYFSGRGWSTKPYQNILRRITKNMANFPGESLLSSHPLTDERIRYLREQEKAVK